MINKLKILSLIFILVMPGPAPGEATATTLLSGIGNYTDGQHITFPTSFATIPTVIVNAALAGKDFKCLDLSDGPDRRDRGHHVPHRFGTGGHPDLRLWGGPPGRRFDRYRQ